MIRKMKGFLIGLAPGVSRSGGARPFAPPVVRTPASGATVHGVVSLKVTTAEQAQEFGAEAKSCGANGQSPYIEMGAAIGPAAAKVSPSTFRFG